MILVGFGTSWVIWCFGTWRCHNFPFRFLPFPTPLSSYPTYSLFSFTPPLHHYPYPILHLTSPLSRFPSLSLAIRSFLLHYPFALPLSTLSTFLFSTPFPPYSPFLFLAPFSFPFLFLLLFSARFTFWRLSARIVLEHKVTTFNSF